MKSLGTDRDQDGPLQKPMPDGACIIDHELDAHAIQSIIRLCLELCFEYCAACRALTSISIRCLQGTHTRARQNHKPSKASVY